MTPARLLLLALLALAPTAAAQDEEPQPLIPGAPVEGRLQAGSPFASFTIEVPEGATSLVLELKATGDADLFVKAGAPLEGPEDADAASTDDGGDESVTLTTTAAPRLVAGTYHVDVVHGQGRRGRPLRYTLVARIESDGPGPGARPAQPGGREPAAELDVPSFAGDFSVQVTIPKGDGLNYRTFRLDVGADVARVELTLRGAKSDCDLLARFGSPMEGWEQADIRADGPGPDETLVLRRDGSPRLRTGAWYLDVARAGDVEVTLTFAGKVTRGWSGEELPAARPGDPDEEGLAGVVTEDSAWTFSLGADEEDYRTWAIVVPRGAKSLLVTVGGVPQDLDLYLRHGQVMRTPRDADHRANGQRPDERLFVDGTSTPPLRPGRYYLDIVRAVKGRIGPAEVVVRFDAPRPPPQAASIGPIQKVTFGERVAVTIERRERKAARFSFDVPAAARSLHVAVLGATRDVDLFLRRGQEVTGYDDEEGHDWRAVSGRLTERLTVERGSTPPLAAGTYYLDVASLVTSDEHIAFKLIVTLDAPAAVQPGDLRLPPFVLPPGATPLERALQAAVHVEGQDGQGSGTCVSPTGLIVTNHHVLEREGKLEESGIFVSFPDALDEPPVQCFLARVVGRDEALDLVLLQVETDLLDRPLPKGLTLPFLPLGDPAKARLGEPLFVAGYPSVGGMESRSSVSVTQGVVSGFETDGRGMRMWLKTDARINAGNSGGMALRVDPKGEYEYVGVPTQEKIEGDDELGFCRPTSCFPEAWREQIRKAGGKAP